MEKVLDFLKEGANLLRVTASGSYKESDPAVIEIIEDVMEKSPKSDKELIQGDFSAVLFDLRRSVEKV